MEPMTTVLNSWAKFGPGTPADVDVHLREVIIDGQYFIELRDYFPDTDQYGTGYLVMHAGRMDPDEERGEMILALRGLLAVTR